MLEVADDGAGLTTSTTRREGIGLSNTRERLRATFDGDHAFSLEPVGMRKMVRDLERTWQALGDGAKKMYPSEVNPIIKMGKKLVANRALPAGHILTERDVAFESPGDGIPPCDIENVLGRTILQRLAEDEAITFECLSR